MSYKDEEQIQEVNHVLYGAIAGQKPSPETSAWVSPTIKKYSSSQPWDQLSFTDSNKGEGTTSPKWFVPLVITGGEVKPEDVNPKFHQDVDIVGDSAILNFDYDLGPLSIMGNSNYNDRFDVLITWRLSVENEQIKSYKLSLLEGTINLHDMLYKSTTVKSALEAWKDNIYFTYFLNGLRSSVKAVTPPRIHFRVMVDSTLLENVRTTALLTVFFVMRKLNSQILYRPLDSGARAEMQPIEEDVKSLSSDESFEELFNI